MKVLMCPPDFFDTPLEDRSLNPWMKKVQRPDKALAMGQWRELKNFYEMMGLDVRCLDPQPDLFDQVFTANLAWGRGRTLVIANLNPEWRRPETVWVARWLLENDYGRHFLPESVKFEGQGDVVALGGGYFLYCYGIRNDLEAMEWLEKIFGLKDRIIPLKLVDKRFYHGDVCIRYSGHRNALLFNPAAFDAESLRRIETLPVRTMEAPKEMWVQETEHGRNFPINGCYVGRTETFPWDRACGEFPKKVQRWIEADGGIVRLHNFDQFGLSGAGHRCCSLFLD